MYFYDVNQSLIYNKFNMANITPWQVTISANNASKAVLTENNLGNVNTTTVSTKKALNGTAKVVVMPKRYSFDDNGGGYRGL